jgi:hypothetical protein
MFAKSRTSRLCRPASQASRPWLSAMPVACAYVMSGPTPRCPHTTGAAATLLTRRVLDFLNGIR